MLGAVPGAMPPRWRVVAASVCGAAHEKTGRTCQDAHGWCVAADGAVVAAVADGAGTAALGELGAKIAVQASLNSLAPAGLPVDLPDDDAGIREQLSAAIRDARGAVEAAAAARETAPRELATTLILLAATPALVAAAQVGDGAAILRDAADNVISLTVPPANGYVNETTFLTSPEALEAVQVAVWRGQAQHVAAFTDGLQMLALRMPGGKPHRPFFTPLFRFMEQTTDEEQGHKQLVEFLRSPRVSQRADDDLTLLLATLLPSALEGERP